MIKRTLKAASLILALIMVLSVSVMAASYSDTKGHWGEQAINEWSDYGVIQGSNGLFRPNDAITRAELAKILSFTLKLEEKAANTFTDLPSAWYTDDVLKCVAAGIMKGDGNGTIRPTDSITREEAFVMVGRALKIQEDPSPDFSKFTDGDKISSWARGYLSQLASLGYINGVGANRMSPRTNINRASVVTILSNAIAQYVYTDGANVTLSGNDNGIVVVAAKNVTLSGVARGAVLVAQGASQSEITLKGTAGKVQIVGDDVKVITENATVLSLVFDGKNGQLKKDEDSLIASTQGSFSNIETPVQPDTPVIPDEPDEPDTPDTPDTPDEPDEPTEPDTPIKPETPEIPIEPVNPGGGLIEDGGGMWTPLG